MDLISTAALKTSTVLVKRILDDVYEVGKKQILTEWNIWRASQKDREVANSIGKITHVKTLWNIEKEVSLYSFYYPSSLEFPEGMRKPVSALKELGTLQNFIIQGTAGQGKSILLRYLCGQELRPDLSSNRLPIFIELRRIRSNHSLKDLLFDSLKKYGFKNVTEDIFDALLKSGKFILLCDAFDEIEPSLVQATLNDIESLSELYDSALQIIVTTRPNSDIQHSASFRLTKIVPLSAQNQLPFLKKVCTEKGQAEALHEVILKSPADVKGLLTTPLMLTLLVTLYKSIQTVPDTVPRFYEELFDVLFYRHDHSKPGFRRKRFTNLDDSNIKSLFSAFCFYVRLNRLSVISLEQLETCCALASKATGLHIDPRKFKDEIVKTVCLMQEEGFEFSFIHKSVAEYYSAAFVSKSSDEFARKFYGKFGDGWLKAEWALELRFLSLIDQYRFSKYFQLHWIAAFENKMSIDFSNELSPSQRDKLTSDFCIGNKIRLGLDKEKQEYRPQGWEHKLLDNPVVESAVEIWLNFLGMPFHAGSIQSIPAGTVNAILTPELSKDGVTIMLPCDRCLQLYQQEVKDDALNKAIDLMKKTKATALEIVRREDEKTKMIDEFLPSI